MSEKKDIRIVCDRCGREIQSANAAAFLHNIEVRTLVCGMTGSPIDTEADLAGKRRKKEDRNENMRYV